MSASVTVSTDTKDKLEQSQADIKRETGRQVTQQELLDRIVSRAFDEKTDLIESFRTA